MYRKGLVNEIQRLAKELNKIPTEEARLLAEMSKSKLGSADFRGSHTMVNQNSELTEGLLRMGVQFASNENYVKAQEDYRQKEEANIRQ